MGTAGPTTKKVKLKLEDQVVEKVDVAEPGSMLKLGTQVLEAMWKVRAVMCPVSLFQNADFQELVEEQELTYGENLLDSLDSLLADPPYNVRSDRKNVYSYYDVSTLGTMAIAVAFGKSVMILGTYRHLLSSALRFGRWYKMLFKEKKEEEIDSDGGEGITTKESESKQKAFFEAEGA